MFDECNPHNVEYILGFKSWTPYDLLEAAKIKIQKDLEQYRKSPDQVDLVTQCLESSIELIGHCQLNYYCSFK